MRCASLAIALTLVASRAIAQPAAEPESPPPPVEKKPEPAQKPSQETVEQELARTPPPPVEVAPKPTEPVVAANPERGFRFGSYGRAIAGTDLRGGKPEKILVVAHGPRIVEDSYLELEFSYGFVRDDRLLVRPVITIALDATLFHDTGDFDAQPAIRNMYLDGKIHEYVSWWVGSRMYRGDDIYLFDYWPLDDQNMIGGGVMLDAKAHILDLGGKHEQLQLATAVGLNRLNRPFQFQEVEVPNPTQGATTVVQLNRQRGVGSLTGAYILIPDEGDGGPGIKLKVHGEFHALPAGERKETDGTKQALPSDNGVLVGAQVGIFGFSTNKEYRRHLNLFARYAQGLAAFDELAPPTSFGPDLKTQRASELSFGLSGNWDHELGNMMVGALSRLFVDADGNDEDPDDGWEYAIAARPLFRVIPDWFVGADVSYQARFPRGLNPITLRASDPAVFQIAPMIAWSPMGPSAYDRPQLRLVYRAAHLNDGALDLYVPDDSRHLHPWVHFLGLEAEWWFNSSTYH